MVDVEQVMRVGDEISCFNEKEEQNSIYCLHKVGKLFLRGVFFLISKIDLLLSIKVLMLMSPRI